MAGSVLPLMDITQRGYFLDAACKIFEGKAHAADLPPALQQAGKSVQVVLFDAQCRAVLMGGRINQPRSLASVIGASVARFLGGSLQQSTMRSTPLTLLQLPENNYLFAYCGALTTDGTLLLHPCLAGVYVVRTCDGKLHCELPYANAAQVFVAADDDVFIAHGETVTNLGASFEVRQELDPPCSSVKVTGVCAGDNVIAAWYSTYGIALYSRDGKRLPYAIAYNSPRQRTLGWNAVTRCVYASDAHYGGFEVFQVDTCDRMPRVDISTYVAECPNVSPHGELCGLAEELFDWGLSRKTMLVVRSLCDSIELTLTLEGGCVYFALARSVLVVVDRSLRAAVYALPQ